MESKVMFYGIPEAMRDRLTVAFQGTELTVIGEIPSAEQILSRLELSHPDVLFLHAEDDRKLISLCQQIYIQHPRCLLIMLGETADEELRNEACLAGVRAVLAPPPPARDLATMIKSLRISENSRLSGVMGASNVVRRNETVCLLSARGGVGKTTAAVNLAVQLAMEKKSVALLDLDLQFGSDDLFLGLEARGTLAELLMEQADPTMDVVNSYFMYHVSGARLLPAPASPEFAESISAGSVEKIVRLLQNYYDYIILDTAAGFSEINLAMLDVSSTILVLTGADLASLKNTRKMLLLLEDLKVKDRVKLVLRKGPETDITLEDVERTLRQKAEGIIEYDARAAGKAINQGKPAVMSPQAGALARSLRTLPSILGAGEPQDRSRRDRNSRKREKRAERGGKGLFGRKGKKTQARQGENAGI